MSCHALTGSFELEADDAGIGGTETGVEDTETGVHAPDTSSGGSNDLGTPSLDTAPDASNGGSDDLGTPVLDAELDGRDTSAPRPDADDALPSCAAHRAAKPTSADGPRPIALPNGERFIGFCDMNRGGFLLVATRSSTTDAAVWKDERPLRSLLVKPDADVDAVLDVDWTQLGFTELVYEFGVSFPVGGGRPPEPTARVTFDQLGQLADNARSALTRSVSPESRLDCSIDGQRISKCIPPPPPPGDPSLGLGWVYSPRGHDCWWAYAGRKGAADCTSTRTSKAARIWVR